MAEFAGYLLGWLLVIPLLFTIVGFWFRAVMAGINGIRKDIADSKRQELA